MGGYVSWRRSCALGVSTYPGGEAARCGWVRILAEKLCDVGGYVSWRSCALWVGMYPGEVVRCWWVRILAEKLALWVGTYPGGEAVHCGWVRILAEKRCAVGGYVSWRRSCALWVSTCPNTEEPESNQTEIRLCQTARYFMPEEYLHGYIKSVPLHATIHRMELQV